MLLADLPHSEQCVKRAREIAFMTSLPDNIFLSSIHSPRMSNGPFRYGVSSCVVAVKVRNKRRNRDNESKTDSDFVSQFCFARRHEKK